MFYKNKVIAYKPGLRKPIIKLTHNDRTSYQKITNCYQCRRKIKGTIHITILDDKIIGYCQKCYDHILKAFEEL